MQRSIPKNIRNLRHRRRLQVAATLVLAGVLVVLFIDLVHRLAVTR